MTKYQITWRVLAAIAGLLFCVALIPACEPANPGVETMRQARVALQQHNYIEAVERAEQAIAQGERSVEVHLIRGHGYMQMNQNPQAVEAFDVAVKYDPYSGEALLYKGLAETRMNQTAEAKASFEQALDVFKKIEADPAKVIWKEEDVSDWQKQRIASEAAVNQAMALSLAGQTMEAIKQMHKVRETYPDYPGLEQIEQSVQSQTVAALMLGIGQE